MQNTINYGLKKPESTDYIDINDFNENVDIIDTQLKENADGLTSLEKTAATKEEVQALSETVTMYKNETTEKLLQQAEEFMLHVNGDMPHQFTDGEKTYRYGFKLNDSKTGIKFIYEEVV